MIETDIKIWIEAGEIQMRIQSGEVWIQSLLTRAQAQTLGVALVQLAEIVESEHKEPKLSLVQ